MHNFDSDTKPIIGNLYIKDENGNEVLLSPITEVEINENRCDITDAHGILIKPITESIDFTFEVTSDELKILIALINNLNCNNWRKMNGLPVLRRKLLRKCFK